MNSKTRKRIAARAASFVAMTALAAFFIFGGQERVDAAAGNAFSEPDYRAGWWYDAEHPGGNGVAIEIQPGNPQGDTLFMGWYSYDEQGQPIWYTSGGLMEGPDHYNGQMLQWSGPPLSDLNGQAHSYPVGSVELLFTGDGMAHLFYALDSGVIGEAVMSRFMDDYAPGDTDPRDINGWWYDPDHQGMGVFIQAQGDTLFMGWYHYRSQPMMGPGHGLGVFQSEGVPTWWSSGAMFEPGDSMYHGTLDEWMGGHSLGGPHMEPGAPHSQGFVDLEFIDDSHAIMSWSGGQLELERFRFYDLP